MARSDVVHGLVALGAIVALAGCGSVAPPPASAPSLASGPGASASGPSTASPSGGPGSFPSVAPSPGPSAAAWVRAPDIEQPAGFMKVHTDANGQPYTRGCSPCHPAIDTIMTGVTSGPAGIVAVGWILQDFRAASWRSTDGTTWHYNGDLGAQTMFAAVAANGSRYVAVGRNGDGAIAWSSTDAKTWRRTASAAAFAPTPLRLTSVVRWRNGFVAAGYQGTEFFTADAAFWASPDGLSWRRAPDATGFRDARVVGVAAGGTGLVAVGQAGPADAPGPVVVWTSRDGLAWTRAPDSPIFHDGRVRAIASVPEVGLVAVGENLAGSIGAVWTSRDGLVWSRVPSGPLFGRPGIQVRMYAVTAGPHGIVVGGTITEGLQYGVAAVWTSPDAIAWRRLPTGVEFLDNEINAAAEWNSRIVAVGDRGAPDAYQATAWLSPPDVGK